MRGFSTLNHIADGVDTFLSIVGGKLTTYRQMAEAVSDRVCNRLGVDAACATASCPLPGADDLNQLDDFVATYDGQRPTDADVSGQG